MVVTMAARSLVCGSDRDYQSLEPALSLKDHSLAVTDIAVSIGAPGVLASLSLFHSSSSMLEQA